jgi:ubiquinone/menaquinone biosynthesis C-methylase UbiE
VVGVPEKIETMSEDFNKWSRTYEQSFLQRIFFDRVHQTVLDTVSFLSEPQSILDVGCGTGRLLRSAQKRWPKANMIGVDPATGMIEVARHLNPHATFYIASAEAIPIPDASIDIALSTLSSHHWSDQAAGIREIARVLRSDGCFVLADHIWPTWVRRLFHGLHTPPQSASTTSALKEIFESSGFRVSKQTRIFSAFVVVILGIRNG